MFWTAHHCSSEFCSSILFLGNVKRAAVIKGGLRARNSKVFEMDGFRYHFYSSIGVRRSSWRCIHGHNSSARLFTPRIADFGQLAIGTVHQTNSFCADSHTHPPDVEVSARTAFVQELRTQSVWDSIRTCRNIHLYFPWSDTLPYFSIL
jgi:hypothetical protein